MTSDHGVFVPVGGPSATGPQDGPPIGWHGGWSAQQPWFGPTFTPMPPVRLDDPPPPASVRAAGWLWLAAALVFLAGWVVAAFLDVPVAAAEMASDPEFGDPSGAVPAAAIIFVIAVAGAALVAVPYPVLGFLLRRRRSWARVLLSVLGALMLVGLVGDVFVGWVWRAGLAPGLDPDGDRWVGFAVVGGLALVQAALVVAAFVSMFTAGANRFFAGGPGGRSGQ